MNARHAYRRAYRDALHTAERAAHVRHQPAPARRNRWPAILAAAALALYFVGAMWLALSDPWTLADAVARLLGDAV